MNCALCSDLFLPILREKDKQKEFNFEERSSYSEISNGAGVRIRTHDCHFTPVSVDKVFECRIETFFSSFDFPNSHFS